uniref:AAA+ ATPase domain-containing protein n=1 Tax=viral metagenome TaxID=1070528 RepID=A0A6C0B0D4_9ZZZZ
MDLSEEQQLAFDKYIQRQNIFITGPGGTGKSTLIKRIQQDAVTKGRTIQVCALTGCAAVLLQCKAKNIHSWSGIGLGNGEIAFYVDKIQKNFYKKKIWKQADILVIDEISMMSQKLFDMLDAIGKAVRKNNKPFGGIQVIFLGDFYQLPPIGDKDEPETMRFCFESEQWETTFHKENTIQLKKIFRQTDKVYTKILNQIREGRLSKSSYDILKNLVGRKVEDTVTVQPTKLFPIRNSVDFINKTKMAELQTTGYEYKIKYLRTIEKPKVKSNTREMSDINKTQKIFTSEQVENELKHIHGNLLCDDTISLKVGSQVMCIVNIEQSTGEMICNGSQGIIIRFNESNLPVVKYTNQCEIVMNYHIWESDIIPGIGVSQIPLILAWAITIHKSQGATMDMAEVDVGSGVFECGQTYVALSRVKSLEGLYLTSFDSNKILINRKVREFYDGLK